MTGKFPIKNSRSSGNCDNSRAWWISAQVSDNRMPFYLVCCFLVQIWIKICRSQYRWSTTQYRSSTTQYHSSTSIFSSLTATSGVAPEVKIPVKSFRELISGSLVSLQRLCWLFQLRWQLSLFSLTNCCSWVIAVKTPPREKKIRLKVLT